MRALCYNGIRDLRVENVPDPGIINPHDAIIRVTLSSVCGSDLHLINGYVPTVQSGDILGHEFIGEVVETGPQVKKLKKGDRVVVASVIACGECQHCQEQSYSLCDNTNPNAYIAEKCSVIPEQRFSDTRTLLVDMRGVMPNTFGYPLPKKAVS
ncbi:alcohol dehydrogenase catalytic domain-containing protein [Siphonobacter sp. BAB-5385]|uniref:alcohol dehydrogenase catalytic domain-containing protein n=1 Tax=Siphonobacter sp. BAB-5385 TaxID=1864822 RepID=UPI0020CE5D29|nr:alcohol dehydrogenase catalytic domain-containing protein [Siphonobacter sp. BAB-5385]